MKNQDESIFQWLNDEMEINQGFTPCPTSPREQTNEPEIAAQALKLSVHLAHEYAVLCL